MFKNQIDIVSYSLKMHIRCVVLAKFQVIKQVSTNLYGCELTSTCPLKMCDWQHVLSCIKPWTNNLPAYCMI